MKFKNWDVRLDTSRKYANGRKAIVLMDATDGEQIAVATVNMPYDKLQEDEVFIKDYSENEGMLNFLVENKIVEYPHETVPSGFVLIYKCRLVS